MARRHGNVSATAVPRSKYMCSHASLHKSMITFAIGCELMAWGSSAFCINQVYMQQQLSHKESLLQDVEQYI